MTTSLTIDHIRYDQSGLLELYSSEQEVPDWKKHIYEFIQEWLNDQDHINVHTSGSTGNPKVIRLRKSHMLFSARQTCDFFGIVPESNLLLCLPANYIAGKMMIVRAFVSKSNLLLRQPSSHPFEKLTKTVDFTAITPFQLHHSYTTLLYKNNIRNMIVGGAEINPELEEQVQNLDTHIYATYGMTETSTHVALRQVNGKNRSSWFTALGQTQFSQDNEGCLIIDNSNILSEKLITNDIVKLKDNQNFCWLGRRDNIINSGGVKLFPEQIESEISSLINRRFIIDRLVHDTLGQVPVLVLEGDCVSSQEKEKLIGLIKPLVDRYAIPHKIYSIATFPFTPTGKIDRLKIRKSLNELDKETE